MRARIAILVVCIAALLAVASSAYAATPSDNAYGPQGGVLGVGGSGGNGGNAGSGNAPATTTRVESTGSLPFTGLQAGLILAAGAGLIGTGIVVRRASRNPAE